MEDLHELGYIGCQTNVPVAPPYAYVQQNDWKDCYSKEIAIKCLIVGKDCCK